MVWFITMALAPDLPSSVLRLSQSSMRESREFSECLGFFLALHYRYVKIDATTGKNLYYYFVTSERNAARDPVVLWLNGGPGASSFDGFVYEHGPFNFEAGGNGGSPILKLNPYSWSKVSNIIYLDSPCGVGYSYSQNPSDYNTGDLQTALDTHNFLLKWFELYPEFISNPFYLTGESYAGVYIPTLASEVIKGIEAGAKPLLNFKGYAIGNGIADAEFDGNAFVPFAHGMALISEDQYQDAANACKGNYFDNEDPVCQSKVTAIQDVVARLNAYDILQPCYEASEEQVPCTNLDIANIWCNEGSVRKAIHAQTEEIAGKWEMISGIVSSTFQRDAGSMIVYHRNVTRKGYRALIYSGDHDMVVPFTGTQAWTKSLGYTIIDQWAPWMVDNQVAGYTQRYDHNLTFATVKGSGHSVPEYKPKESLAFYSRWLAGNSLSNTT